MKEYTIEEVQDDLLGRVGTPSRDLFEYELQMEIIGKAIKNSRLERNLTQEELGKLIGVQKAQISRLENNPNNVRLDTLIRVFKALKANIKFQIELPDIKMNIG
jgi:predicted transcriptional regulator